MSGVKEAVPYLPKDSAVYFSFAAHFNWLPDWYRLYSVLEGVDSRDCDDSTQYMLPNNRRRFTMVNCSDASTEQVADFAQHLQQALDSVEHRFDDEIQVSTATFTLISKNGKYKSSDTQLLGRTHLRYEVAVRFDSQRPHTSQMDAVSSTGHELYHMAWAALSSHDPAITLDLTEEARASIFSSCVEHDVFGTIREQAFDARVQFDPKRAVNHAVVYDSANGGVRATRMLRKIAGSDQTLSSSTELSQFEDLCRSMIE